MLGLLSWTVGCRVPPPKLEAVADYGFGSPEQAFSSFRTAFQGELLELEHRCFSLGFCRRNRLSNQAYREMRPQLLEEHPFLRWGLYRAQITAVERLSETAARIRATIPVFWAADPELVVHLVREDLFELWADEDYPLAEGFGEPGEFDLFDPADPLFVVEEDPETGASRVWFRVETDRVMDQEALRRAFHLLEASREWKIDGFEVREPDA